MSGTGDSEASACGSRPVERVDELSRQDFRKDYLLQSRPVVVTGGVRDWPALKRWSLEALRERVGHRPIEVGSSVGGIFSYDLGAPRATYESMAFSSAAALITEGRGDIRFYIMQRPLEHDLPELRDDVPTFDLLPGEASSPHFWLGGGGIVTPLHWDNLHNLYGHILGKKRFTLFPPAELDHLYPYPATALFSHMSYADPEDTERWPRLCDAERLECILEPGDLLFLPAFWWHHVRSLELSISVNFWWAPGLSQCLVPAFLRTLRAAYTRDRLAGLHAPVSTFPAGPIGAARAALRCGQPEFALLFAAAALEDAVRSRCGAIGIDDWEGGAPRPIEALDADLAARGAYPPGLERVRFGAWNRAIGAVTGDLEAAGGAEAAAVVAEIGAFVTALSKSTIPRRRRS